MTQEEPSPTTQSAPESKLTDKSRMTPFERFAPGTIRGILLLAMTFVLAPVIVLEVGLHVQRYETRRIEEQRANLEVARAVAANFEHFVDDLLRHEQAVAGAISPMKNMEQVRFVLDTETSEHLAVHHFFWSDANGRVLAQSTNEVNEMGLADQRFFRELLDGREWVVGELEYAAQPAFVVAYAKHSQSGLQGVLGGVVDPMRLGDKLHVERSGGGIIAVYDRAGKVVLAHPDDQVDGELLEDHGLPWAGDGTTGVFRTRSGTERLGALAPISSIGWTVEASRPTGEAMAAEVQDTITEAIIYLFVGLFAVLTAFGIARGITIPLRRLRSHAVAIGMGRLDRQIAIDRPVELAELANAFNRMAKEIAVREADLHEHVEMLEEAEDELRAARDELETKVVERTDDLAASEERLRSVMQTAIQAIIVVDAQSKVVFWNRGAEHTFGYEEDEIVGHGIHEIVPERLHSAQAERIRITASGGVVSSETQPLEVVCLRKDGTEFPAELSLGSFTSRGQLYVTGILRDLTHRKQADAAVQEHVQRLRSTLERSVQAMALLVETRDPYTAGHQRRVADLAGAIAFEMDLSGEQQMVVRMASAVHDIGKVAVPAEILVKPGVITEWEMDLIRVHPQTGYEILKTIEFPWPIAEIVRQHHERIDGSGYPRGLAADAILVEARIIAVADVVEAMASFRPYRPAIGLEEALREITQAHPTRYDQEVVASCCRVLSDGRLGWH